MGALIEEEVETIFDLENVNGVLVCLMTQDELLHPQERPLVRHFLPHLHERVPCVLRFAALTMRALLVADHILDDERLLQQSPCNHLLLDCHPQPDAL